MKRDLEIIQKKLRKAKNDVVKKCLREEAIKIKNRMNSVKERDIEQQSKANLRKEDVSKVSKGEKKPFFMKVTKKQLSGAVKTGRDQPKKVQVKQEYLKNKFSQLKQEGKLDKYMRKRRKKVNSKFKQALNKKGGRGWLDN
ncbi:hypothetical protein RFI_37064 [Reticulomyxa filosa]|uniref:Uncharacterized protein n=1 Tax=Reticulomyxa filosa TaxID=46433 RepID=X6LEJ3_RETFI|nr:hypothetical protein RFI_37064 [Reticulomyxa filosa]|eukprot:ETO00383.1 hypothetical protein RFI_37064 [Reticulomyxa filosa]